MKRFLHLTLVVVALLALCAQSPARQKEETQSRPNPLVKTLQSKGIITE